MALVELLVADAVDLLGLASLFPQWGIFLGGAPVVLAETVLTVEYKQSFTISDYPVEEGSFESYDKVYVPFDVRFKFATGGSVASKQALLDSIAAIISDLNLYDVVTPEAVYTSVNLVSYDYNRAAMNGLGLLSVNVAAQQVKVVAAAAPGNAQSPSNAAQVNNGTAQAATPTPAQSGVITDVITGGAVG